RMATSIYAFRVQCKRNGPARKALTRPSGCTIIGDWWRMKALLSAGIAAILIGAPLAMAQTPAAPQTPASARATTNPKNSTTGDAYYYFTLGHLQELQYETTNKSQFADDSIESYKKALELDPGSAVIQERLAEIHAKSGHVREATEEAQAALKIDPDNVDAHRLLARIYV